MKVVKIFGVVFAVAAFVAYVYYSDKSHIDSLRHADRAHFTPDGTKIVVVDLYAHYSRGVAVHPRIRVYDAHTGAALGLAPLSDSGTSDCIPAGSDKVWCCARQDAQSPILLNLSTLATIAEFPQIKKLSPGFADGFDFSLLTPPAVDLQDGALLVLAKADGRLYRISPELVARAEPKIPAHTKNFSGGSYGPRGGATAESVSLGNRELSLEREKTGKRSALSVTTYNKHKYAYDSGYRVTVAPHPEQTYLEAGFLVEADNQQIVELQNPPSAVLAHGETDQTGRHLVLSRVNGAGDILWNRQGKDEHLLSARLVGDTLIVVSTDTLIGLDAKSGAVRFQQILSH